MFQSRPAEPRQREAFLGPGLRSSATFIETNIPSSLSEILVSHYSGSPQTSGTVWGAETGGENRESLTSESPPPQPGLGQYQVLGERPHRPLSNWSA